MITGYVVKFTRSNKYFGNQSYWSDLDDAKIYTSEANVRKGLIARGVEYTIRPEYKIIKVQRTTIIVE